MRRRIGPKKFIFVNCEMIQVLVKARKEKIARYRRERKRVCVCVR